MESNCYRAPTIYYSGLFTEAVAANTDCSHPILTWLGHVSHVHPLLLGHEPQEGEDDCPGKDGGAGVDTADYQSVFIDIVVIFVVGAQGYYGSQTQPIRKENLWKKS